VISRSSPVRVGLLTDWKFVGIGGLNGFAIKTNGTLWAWGVGGGTGANGVLGLGDLISTSSPVQVGNGIDWAFVTTAGNRCWAIKTDSTLWAWGYNGTGRLGHNNTISRSSPVQIGTDTDWAIVSGGFDHSLAIRKTGTLWGWGQPARGALGLNNSTPPRSSPVQVGTDTNWKDVSVGPNFTVALRSNGTLWSWGIGNVGQLGLNSTTDITNGVSSPAAVGALTNWKNISAAAGFCTAIKTDGTLWAWGSGNSVGVNSSVNRSSPIQVGSFTDWKSVSSRRASVLARR
jgi:alpha-tubulin suppressor-like RCC1 family protein